MSGQSPAESRGEDELVHLVVALPCEARPLIDALALRPIAWRKPFRHYANPQADLSLTISGPGIDNAAGAVIAVSHLYPPAAGQVHGWLNMGVAGHAHHAPGRAFLACAVHAPGSSYFPQFVHAPPLPLLPVHSDIAPCLDHGAQVDSLKDMEASGFCAMASRLAPAECVHCLKIVSDNAWQGPDTVRASRISDWVQQQLPAIRWCIACLRDCCRALRTRPVAPEQLQRFRRHAHFTVSQRRQLGALLHRWRLLRPQHAPEQLLAAGDDASGILRKLRQGLELP